MNARDEALLNDLIDGRLDPTEVQEVKSRLEHEPELGEAWQELRRIRAMLRADPVPGAPPDFLGQIHARIRETPEAAPQPRRLHLVGWLGALTAAAAAILVAVLLFDRDPPAPRTVESAFEKREASEADALMALPGSPAPEESAPPEPVRAEEKAGEEIARNERDKEQLAGLTAARSAPSPTAPGVAAPMQRPASSPEGARRSRLKTHVLTVVLESQSLQEGRDHLALAVGSLGRHDRGQWATWQDGKARLLPLTPELEQQKVLGSVVLSLTPAQLDVLGSAEHAGKASLRSAAAKARKALKGKPGEDVERVPVRVLIVEPRADSSGR